VLQIENEFYSYIRPKQTTESGERPSLALKARGVEYVEMRALDIDPFAPTGVDADGMRFHEAFLLLCAFLDSPPISAEEQRVIDYNQLTVALRGREPGLKLRANGRSRALQEWAAELCAQLEPLCAALDTGDDERPYARALAAQRGKITDPRLLPSARVLAAMRERGQSFGQFALDMSVRHKAAFAARVMPPQERAAFAATAERSIAEQARIEAADRVDFDTYLADYFSRVP
jgi:glutamate--cysteine ligase